MSWVSRLATGAFRWVRSLFVSDGPEITVGEAELTAEELAAVEAPEVTVGEAVLTPEELSAIASEETLALTPEEIELVERLTNSYVEASPEDKAAIVKGPGLFTEAQKVFIDARAEEMSKPTAKKLKPRWKFVAVIDNRTSHICRALNGTCLEAGDPRWSTMLPPLHPNCRSHVAPVDDTEDLQSPTIQALEILSKTVKP
jgi:SPP1 gp7 family putative phage head morphogenesis protein